jgi:opacity protein-like surface antigen
MTTRIATLILAGALLVLAAAPAAAENFPWTVELRGGAALPTGDLGDSELNTGFGFEGTLGYQVQKHLWAYAGWDWMHFGSDADVDFEETGYAFGVRFVHPLSAGSDLRYLVRLGGTYDHIEVENADGDLIADSDHGLGWEAGLGLVIPLDDRWDLTPGIRYRSLSGDLAYEQGDVDVDLQYVAIEVGGSYRF